MRLPQKQFSKEKFPEKNNQSNSCNKWIEKRFTEWEHAPNKGKLEQPIIMNLIVWKMAQHTGMGTNLEMSLNSSWTPTRNNNKHHAVGKLKNRNTWKKKKKKQHQTKKSSLEKEMVGTRDPWSSTWSPRKGGRGGNGERRGWWKRWRGALAGGADEG